jgi:peptide/nickel transport system substrate-binding protein
MFRTKKWFAVLNLLAVAGLILSACATPTPTSPPAAQPTSPPPAQPTSPPPPTAVPERPGTKSKDPTTFTWYTFGDVDTFDPAIQYDTASSGASQNIFEGLVTFDGADPNAFKPVLAEAIPDPVFNDDGSISYTWTLKKGVKFHAGGDLEPSDVAYSFWRSMLLGDHNTPAFLMLEAFLGAGVAVAPNLIDPSGALDDDPELLKAADADAIVAACERIKASVVADNAAGTVTTNLAGPWGPFFATLAGGGWAWVVDEQWQVENGDWDGDCATWPNFYGIPSESGLFQAKANGTGPYMLDSWLPEEELVLVANEGYWGGAPTIKRYVIKLVNEFGTRFAALQAGDADKISVGAQSDYVQMDTLVGDECDINTGECTTVNQNGMLRKYAGFQNLSRTDIYFNFNAGESAFIGSGQVDGEGVPPDFFSDVHIRRAFNYCFDWDTYIQDVQLGLGQKGKAITLPGQPGYEGTPEYTFDLAKCEEEFRASTWAAEDGTSLWDTGFYLQILYNAGNTARQAIAEILASGVAQANPAFFISSVALPWPTYLRNLRGRTLPLATSGWQEDIHDPHNWYVPYLQGTYATRFNLPAELMDKYTPLIEAGVAEVDPAKRAEIYGELNKMIYEDAPLIILSVPTSNIYEPLYLHGWWEGQNRNPLISPFWVADLSKD